MTKKHIHILGIAGTFMAGIAMIAKQLGYQVSGQDQAVYPPMSEQLKQANIAFSQGYHAAQLPGADLYIIGNALSRGNACVEHILNTRLPYTSGAAFLKEIALNGKKVLAVAGTHGKTSTTSMLTWILEYAGLKPSFLIGGVANNFENTARLTNSDYFVIEADEYDSAFFDKRAKFVHYQPHILIINNLEFDHADIYDDISQIQKQFHHLLRLVPANGLIISPENNENINQVIQQGCWTKIKTIGKPKLITNQQGCAFEVNIDDKNSHTLQWQLLGEHNKNNALAAILAATHIGISVETAIAALKTFKGVKRRLEIIARYKKITIYDDFAHHPTAIATTLSGLRQQVANSHITAVVELASNTMKMAYHQQTLIDCLDGTDEAIILANDCPESLKRQIKQSKHIALANSSDAVIKQLNKHINKRQHIVLMSNGAFAGLRQYLTTKWQI